MRLYTYLLLILTLPLFSTAQDKSPESVFKSKIAILEQRLQAEIAKTTYFKEALDLRSQGVEHTVGDISIRVTKVFGNREEQKVYVQGIVTYKGTTKQSLQFQDHDLIAPTGNQFKGFSAGLPNKQNETFHVPNAEAGIPYAFSIQIGEVNEALPTFALLRLKLHGQGIRGIQFDFKGLDIDWK